MEENIISLEKDAMVNDFVVRFGLGLNINTQLQYVLNDSDCHLKQPVSSNTKV